MRKHNRKPGDLGIGRKKLEYLKQQLDDVRKQIAETYGAEVLVRLLLKAHKLGIVNPARARKFLLSEARRLPTPQSSNVAQAGITLLPR